MDKEFEKKYHKEETNNWWFRGRRDIIIRLLKKRFRNKNSSILDVGCSGGVLLKKLKDNGYHNVQGVDISKEAVDLAKDDNLKVMEMDAANLTFDSNIFDIVIASDILEHLQNEIGSLQSWHRVLKKDGSLILFVPAFMFLWSGHDELNHHIKRYSMKYLIRILKENNFKVNYTNYWNVILFIPIAFMIMIHNLLPSRRNQDRLYHINPFINTLLFLVLRFENIIGRFLRFPFGLSLMIIAKKR